MSQLIRDPMWQFVGAALSLVAIAISLLLFYRQRQRKCLAYRITTSTPVLTVDEEIRGKLAISYEDTPVKNVQLLLLKIMNGGNLPIASTDFEQSLSISFGETAKILSHEIVNSAPHELCPNISLRNNELILDPLLLNPTDQITLKCLLSDHRGQVNVMGRIIGVPRIIQLKDMSLRRPEAFVLWAIGGLVGFLGGVGLGEDWPFLYISATAAALSLFLYAFVRAKRNQAKEPRHG